MQIFRNIDEINLSNKPKVIALGNFDGVHLGHQKLITMAKTISYKIAGETLVFTFYPHPQFVFNPNFKMLNTLEIKARLIEKLGIDYLIALPFNKNIFKLSPQEFVKDILYTKLKVSDVVAGFNYSFGYKGQGKADDLVVLTKELGINTTIMEPFFVDDQLVSSTKVRNYLELGQVEAAKKLLGYAPLVKGKVVEGNKIGRLIGFPTANLEWDKNILIPKCGVYAVQIVVNGHLKIGVLNIGLRPTVSNDKKITMEVNIFDFTENIYNNIIEVIFHKKLRDEKKFDNLAQLKNQINIDLNQAKKYFAKYL